MAKIYKSEQLISKQQLSLMALKHEELYKYTINEMVRKAYDAIFKETVNGLNVLQNCKVCFETKIVDEEYIKKLEDRIKLAYSFANHTEEDKLKAEFDYYLNKTRGFENISIEVSCTLEYK